MTRSPSHTADGRTSERPARAFPAPNGLTGVGMIVLDPTGRVLLGLAHDGRWELPGGKVDAGESFEQAGARELAEETTLRVRAEDVRVCAVVLDGERGLPRVSAAALVTEVEGAPEVTEPDKIARWQWHRPESLPSDLFMPSAAVLHAWRPDLALPDVPALGYPLAATAPGAAGAPAAGTGPDLGIGSVVESD
ncbi:NUDIX hydrolase [Streptomyces sp. NPDC059176]|uniref:nucleotide triphosphate diphosphatase NUDT15 n=1 Tax=unclassified Streptomyces TaxID=2593676 RepID=UPI0036C5837A